MAQAYVKHKVWKLSKKSRFKRSEFVRNLQFRVCEFRKVSLGFVISCTGQTIFAWRAASGQEVEIGKWFLTFLLNVSSFHLERGQFLLMCAKISPRCLITLGTSCWALMSNKNDHYIMKKGSFFLHYSWLCHMHEESRREEGNWK